LTVVDTRIVSVTEECYLGYCGLQSLLIHKSWKSLKATLYSSIETSFVLMSEERVIFYLSGRHCLCILIFKKVNVFELPLVKFTDKHIGQSTQNELSFRKHIRSLVIDVLLGNLGVNEIIR